MLPDPCRREFDVFAKLGLTKRAAKLLCDAPLALRSRRRVWIELDRLFFRPKYFSVMLISSTLMELL